MERTKLKYEDGREVYFILFRVAGKQLPPFSPSPINSSLAQSDNITLHAYLSESCYLFFQGATTKRFKQTGAVTNIFKVKQTLLVRPTTNQSSAMVIRTPYICILGLWQVPQEMREISE